MSFTPEANFVVNLLPLSLRPIRRSRERHERPSCSKFATGINDTSGHSLPVSLTPAVRLELQIFRKFSDKIEMTLIDI